MKHLKTKDLILIALFTALTAIGAFIKIPISSVPFTLQTFFVVLSGLLLGARNGAISQIVYIAIGLVGIPIFATGGGIGYIASPTFGFLLGFILSAYLSGRLIQLFKGIDYKIALLIAVVGLLSPYLIGVPYFYFIKNLYLHKAISFIGVIDGVMLPFLIFDGIKCVVITAIAPAIYKVLKKPSIM